MRTRPPALAHLRFAKRAIDLAGLAGIGATFSDHHENQEAVDGDWRLLNMETPPFGLPPPFAPPKRQRFKE